MNPNQLMISKAMVAQTALREEAREYRRRARSEGSRPKHHVLGLLRRR